MTAMGRERRKAWYSILRCSAAPIDTLFEPLLTGIQHADTSEQRNAFDWQQGLPVARSVDGQQSDHGTMPLWRCEIPHIGRVRELFPVPLLPLPQGQRIGPFGKPVFVHSQTHLGFRRGKHQDVSSRWFTPHEGLLLHLRIRTAYFPAGDWFDCGASRVARKPVRHATQRAYLLFQLRELGQRPSLYRKD